MLIRSCVFIGLVAVASGAMASDITGKVLGLDGEAIDNVSVTVTSQANDLLGSATTDQNGRYRVQFNGGAGSVILSFKKQTRTDVNLANIAGGIQGGVIDVVEPALIGGGRNVAAVKADAAYFVGGDRRPPNRIRFQAARLTTGSFFFCRLPWRRHARGDLHRDWRLIETPAAAADPPQ